MKIFVYDLAAEDGGGLQVLRNFYYDAIELNYPDTQWIFLTSASEIKPADKVYVINRNKGSRLSRFFFEFFKLPRLIRRVKPDLVISLQNMPIFRCRKSQYVYLHQSLQYCKKRFSFLKKEERSLAFRQKVICGLYHKTLRRADHIFVQTEWIRAATIKWLKSYPSEKISVVPVYIDRSRIPDIPNRGEHSKVFFYPARAEIYKNHSVIIDACRILEQEGFRDYRIVFTFDSSENAYAERLFKDVEGLPISFVGRLSYDEMWDYYSKSILLFPSYLETCGLPLIEAKTAGAKIIASDMPFSHEALGGYGNAWLFPFNNPEDLAFLMKTVPFAPYKPNNDNNCILSEKASLVNAMLQRFTGGENEESSADNILS